MNGISELQFLFQGLEAQFLYLSAAEMCDYYFNIDYDSQTFRKFIYNTIDFACINSTAKRGLLFPLYAFNKFA